MSTRQEMIKELMEMQKKFIAYEKSQENGFDMADYYVEDPTHPLYNFRQDYDALAMKIVEQAHADRGSKA